jgi:hypothetical protein
MNVAGAAMDATDAYVFPTRQQKRSSKKSIDGCIDVFNRPKGQTVRGDRASRSGVAVPLPRGCAYLYAARVNRPRRLYNSEFPSGIEPV